MFYSFKKHALVVFFSGALLVLAACEKETNDYDLTVAVTVNDTTRVQNALVRVYAPVKGTFLDYYQYTNENGETVFNIDSKAVVEVVAAKGSFKSCSFKELFNGGNTITIDLKAFGNTENGCQ